MKAKNRKPPDARTYARVKAMPAVGCSCTFEEALPIVAALLRRTGEAKKRARVQKKMNHRPGEKRKFESLKVGYFKRIAYFCTCRLALRTPKASCLYLQTGDVLINSMGDGTLGRVAQYWGIEQGYSL